MIKLIYVLWKEAARDKDAFRDQLTERLAPELLAHSGVHRLRVLVVDSAVEPASHKRIAGCGVLPDAVISVYLGNGGTNSPDEYLPIDYALAAGVSRSACYRVEEAEPLANLAHPAVSGERVYGYCQVVFLERPAHLDEARWLELWQGRHTQTAIDTQATFGYRQNRILNAHSEEARVVHAMVEENFPPEAMSSELAFYGASTAAELRAKQSAMMESCARFIDFDKIDVIPMSEYCFQG